MTPSPAVESFLCLASRASRGVRPAGAPPGPPRPPGPRAAVWFILAATLLAAGGVGLVGCRNAGSVTYENARTGERVTVRQPPKSVAPAIFRRGPSEAASSATATSPRSTPTPPNNAPVPSIEASTGQQQTHDFAAEAQSRSLTWVGILLLLAGIAGIVLRAYLPAVPISASLLAMGGGLLFLMLPGLLAHPVLLWAVLGAIATLGLVGWIDNRHKLRAATTATTATPTPAA